eukprot:49521-Pyramimonas_sp.AAC.1
MSGEFQAFTGTFGRLNADGGVIMGTASKPQGLAPEDYVPDSMSDQAVIEMVQASQHASAPPAGTPPRGQRARP